MRHEKTEWKEKAKKAAAKEAAKHVEDGFILGLGSGSTAAYAIREIGKRIREEELEVLAVPTSYQALLLATENHIPLTTLYEHPEIDLTIDGADQIDSELNMIKGGGGALTREKIVASSSKKVIIVADETKLVKKLGVNNCPVPVEVLPFAVPYVAREITKLGGEPVLRESGKKVGPTVTDNGNFLIDAYFGSIETPRKLHAELKIVSGVVENGLFIDTVNIVILGGKEGIREIEKK